MKKAVFIIFIITIVFSSHRAYTQPANSTVIFVDYGHFRNYRNYILQMMQRKIKGGIYRYDLQAKPYAKLAIKKKAGTIYRISADASGKYSVSLEDGEWIISACDSPEGYKPLYWKVMVTNGDIKSYESIERENIVLDHIFYFIPIRNIKLDIRPDTIYIELNKSVSLKGNGLSCSGKIVLDLGSFGSIEINNFYWSGTEDINFSIPDNIFEYVAEKNKGEEPETIFARIYYVNGQLISNALEIKIKKRPDEIPVSEEVDSFTRKTTVVYRGSLTGAELGGYMLPSNSFGDLLEVPSFTVQTNQIKDITDSEIGEVKTASEQLVQEAGTTIKRNTVLILNGNNGVTKVQFEGGEQVYPAGQIRTGADNMNNTNFNNTGGNFIGW